MTFTGNENHDISLSEASQWTANYRNANPGQVIAHALGSGAITAILTQSGCVGIRVYYALNNEGEKQIVIVGVDSQGNDLYNGLLADRTFNCPPICSTANPLNS